MKIPAKDFDGAGCGHEEREDHPDGRTFTRPIGPQEAEDIAAVDFEV
jgi:hypothetical protein